MDLVIQMDQVKMIKGMAKVEMVEMVTIMVTVIMVTVIMAITADLIIQSTDTLSCRIGQQRASPAMEKASCPVANGRWSQVAQTRWVRAWQLK
jgi:hypothetical protein